MGIIRTKSHTPPPKRPNVVPPSRHCQVLRIRHFVRPRGFVFVFSCVVPVVSRQVSRPKEKKKVKKKRKRARKVTKKNFFRVKEQRQASYSSRPCVGRFLDSRLGRTKKKKENLGLPAFSTKSACSRIVVNFPYLLSSLPHTPSQLDVQPCPSDWQAVCLAASCSLGWRTARSDDA